MKKEDNRLSEFRKQIADLLLQFGYDCHTFNPQKDVVKEPRPDGWYVEQDIKEFNLGEAFYQAEDVAGTVDTLYYSAYHDSQKLNECRDLFTDLLLYGKEFTYEPRPGEKSYGLVNLIDSMHPEKNAFRVVQNWENAAHDGFLWDFVITVNSMPLVAVVLEPTKSGHEPLQDASDLLEQELGKDPCLSTYVQFCIISDGKVSKIKGDSLKEELSEDPLKFFRSMLPPEQLLDLLQPTDEGVDTVSYETLFFKSILSQLAVVEQEFGSIQPDSVYYDISQKAEKRIDHFLENVSDQFDYLEETKGGGLKPTPLEIDEKGGTLKVPSLDTPKAKYRPQKDVYTEDPAEQERIIQGILDFLLASIDPKMPKNLKLENKLYKSSHVIACLWSACGEHLENVNKGSLKAFCALFDAACDLLPTERKFSLTYSAVEKMTEKWKEKFLGYNPYTPLFLHELSIDDLEKTTDKTELTHWKNLYSLVVDLARVVQLLPPISVKEEE